MPTPLPSAPEETGRLTFSSGVAVPVTRAQGCRDLRCRDLGDVVVPNPPEEGEDEGDHHGQHDSDEEQREVRW